MTQHPSRPSGASTEPPRPATKRGQVLLDDLRAIIPPGLWTPFREEQIAGSIAAVELAGAASTEATPPDGDTPPSEVSLAGTIAHWRRQADLADSDVESATFLHCADEADEVIRASTEATERPDLLDVERLERVLRADTTVRTLTMRLGTFNDAWWERFASEVAAAYGAPTGATSPSEPPEKS